MSLPWAPDPPLLPSPLDVAPLTARVRRGEARRTWRALMAEQRGGDFIDTVRRVVMTVAGAGGLLVFPTMAATAIGFLREGTSESLGQFFGIGSFALIMTVATAVLLRTAVKLWMRRTSPMAHHRLATFADANGLDYFAGPVGPQPDGPWLGRGALNLNRVLRSRRVDDDDPWTRAKQLPDHRIEIADYEIRGNRRNTAPQFGGYIAIRLPLALPHLILRAQDGPRRVVSSAAVPLGTQRLELEGAFDTYFHLHCPAGYERDALYLFTPDVMSRLLDHARGLDVEIVDRWMILASPRVLVTTAVDRWRAIADVVDALDDRIVRWSRWRDDRMPTTAGAAGPEAEAPDGAERPTPFEGRRLRLRPGSDVVVIAIVAVLFLAAVAAANLL
ncbi:hypothetical protein [Schumannella sp. 10F1B-5-1]|uniref:hypothetical protein n=1 Tax=Schumannella sp. 10F1B-5-1 TaxID=2590780 RepID=UPI001131D7A0|nr:hypothetical protein [Schumannella sp. 10F1B-5-1]TPW78317.1 hypothetical protein FJ658_00470 [Schumannella sp. 10F1B-5-1]